jgi:hypothetical protein
MNVVTYHMPLLTELGLNWLAVTIDMALLTELSLAFDSTEEPASF